MLSRPDLILIDVDGTLVDSVPDLAFCIDQMVQQFELPARGENRVRNWVGNGVERLVQRALTDDLDGMPDADLYRRALPVFMELYADNTSKRSVLYPGVIEGLEYLRQSGYQVGAVTNKAARFTEPLLADLGLSSYFGLIISGDTLARKKPDPLPLLHAAEFFRTEPGRCLMIGDSVSDVKAARAAGFSIICMSYGYNHGVDIRDAEPDVVIDSMSELPDLLPIAA